MSPLRRLAAALRGERWWQVALELALLVGGILIALAVDGWMDDRRDARLERTYLERLERDLAQSQDTMEGFVTFERQQTADGVLAYRGLRGVPEIGREPVAEALSHLANRRTLRLQAATYRDLLSTGNLRLIRNPELREAIVRLYEEADRTTTVVDRNNQVLVDQAYGLPLLDRAWSRRASRPTYRGSPGSCGRCRRALACRPTRPPTACGSCRPTHRSAPCWPVGFCAAPSSVPPRCRRSRRCRGNPDRARGGGRRACPPLAGWPGPLSPGRRPAMQSTASAVRLVVDCLCPRGACP